MPERVWRRRTAGWKAPIGTTFIDRTSSWGNPWGAKLERIDGLGRRFAITGPGIGHREVLITDQVDAHRFVITRYFNALTRRQLPYGVDDVRAQLAGRNLGCFCGLHLPCHVDVTLLIANSHGPVTRSMLAEALAPYQPHR